MDRFFAKSLLCRRGAKATTHCDGAAREELIVLLGVVVLVLTVFTTGIWMLYRQRQTRTVRADIAQLVSAASRFYDENGIWPTEHSGIFGDFRYGREDENAAVIHALRAVDGPGNEDHAVNPRRITYFQAGPAGRGRSGLDSRGNFVDPWGHQYQIVLDTDLDDSCEMAQTIYERRTGEGIAVWSLGRDGQSGTPDDILSWKD